MEKVVLKSLLNREYCSAVLHHLQPAFFDGAHKPVFEVMRNIFVDHQIIPSKDVMEQEIGELKINSELKSECTDLLDYMYNTPIDEKVIPYIIQKTEKWGLERSVYNAIVDGIEEFNVEQTNFGKIYQQVKDAVTFSFEDDLGLMYLKDSEERFRMYQEREEKMPFDIKALDDLTDGGYEKGNLIVWLAVSGGGKSIALVNMAANAMLRGKNVMYISLEMSPKKIAARIDAKLFNMPVWKVPKLDEKTYTSQIDKVKNKSMGDIVIKQYPTSAASALDFIHLIEEMKLKKGFKPDLIIVDYLGIARPARAVTGNTYVEQKVVAEELRALAVQYDVPVHTAQQFSKGAYKNSDAGMEHTADSMGVVHTADALISIFQNEELEEQNSAIIKFIKNRYGPVDVPSIVGLNKEYMSLFDQVSDFDVSQSGKQMKDKDDQSAIEEKFKPKKLKTNDFKFGS